MLILELLLAAAACAQTRSVLPPAGLGALPALQAPAAPLPALNEPGALPAPEALRDASPLELSHQEPTTPESAPAQLHDDGAAVQAVLQNNPIEQAGEGDAFAAGERLQGILEGAPSGLSRGLPALEAEDAPEQAVLHAAPQGPEASASELLRRVESRSTREALKQKIYADPLTGLLKRAWVHDQIVPILSRNTAVMVLDLDHFKKGMNDRYGHDVGDIALAELARIMKQEAPAGRVLVRWGGEEFVIVDRLGRRQAAAAAESLRRSIEKRLGPAVRAQAKAKLGRDIEPGVMTASIGVAPLRKGAELSDFLAGMEQADRQLFEAKNGGRNQVRAAAEEDWAGARREPALWERALDWLKAAGRRRPAPPSAAHADELLAQVQDPALREALSRKLYTDALTGLYNRAHLSDHVEALAAANRSILYVDVDRFKKVNDLHGHVKAGQVLAVLAGILKDYGGDSVYLMGGEEFMVLTPGAPEEAAALAERLREGVQARLGPEAGLETLTVSVGVAGLDKTLPAREALQAAVTAADQALYQAKQTGRNRVVLAPLP